jgi:hypothetical protein
MLRISISEELIKQRGIEDDVNADVISRESHPELWQTLMEATRIAFEAELAILLAKDKAAGRESEDEEEDEEIKTAYERGKQMTEEEYEAWHREVWGYY